MRKLFLALTLASSAALLLAAPPAGADEPAPDAEIDVRALIADIFRRAQLAPAEPAEDQTAGLEHELSRNLKLELRYSRGPFEEHLNDPRQEEHYVFLELRARL